MTKNVGAYSLLVYLAAVCSSRILAGEGGGVRGEEGENAKMLDN